MRVEHFGSGATLPGPCALEAPAFTHGESSLYGNPARVNGYVCRCGQKLTNLRETSDGMVGACPAYEAENILTYIRVTAK